MRYPAVAGQFYEGREDALRKQIEECFLHSLGPGEIPKLNDGERKIKGAVVPHAGYMFSGPVAAHVCAALASDGFPETFIIIGPKHSGFGSPVAITTEEFKTPLGNVAIDMELAKKLHTGVIDDDITAHRSEHSIEVQLPFLQYIKPNIKFVPLCIGHQTYRMAREIGGIISKAIEGKDVVVLASTDFSHYVPKEIAEKKDMKAIEAIINLDAKSLYKTVDKLKISMCGYGPVMTMIEAVGGKKASLLKYSTSGDVMDMRDVVGYGAVVVK
ncbi:MAG: MEMO1 family protein [Methanomassiliicoccales archaeon]|nr:MAG: MEMO1 family protein [Methanomassiliicoccales archaeon]